MLSRSSVGDNRTKGRPETKTAGDQDDAGGQKKKWFQVTRFPALLTAGIHGSEHRNWKRRTIRLSAPPPPGYR